jgi:hypothetical protein
VVGCSVTGVIQVTAITSGETALRYECLTQHVHKTYTAELLAPVK